MFTLTDKALLDRAARMINGSAKELRVEYEGSGWATTEAGRKAKQEYDRLLRDERDMRSLGKRLCTHFDVKAAPRGMEAASAVLGTAIPIGDVTSTGNPESTPAPEGGTVTTLPASVGEEVHDG
jgi:hypothetical protein